MKDRDFPWTVDADSPLQAVLDDPACPPLLVPALAGVLAWQTCNETTVRRALMSTRIAPQFVAALLALGATVILDRVDGRLELELQAPLQDGGVREASMIRVHVSDATRWGEARVARTPTDEPIVAAFAVVELAHGTVREARVALTGAWREPARLADAPNRLVGGPLDEESIEVICKAVRSEAAPVGDFRGSEEYRRAMAGVMARRALTACLCWDGEAYE